MLGALGGVTIVALLLVAARGPRAGFFLLWAMFAAVGYVHAHMGAIV